MSNPIRKPAELDPRGPEGMPVDAPDNDAPAISPHAVSRMHRAEDDDTAINNSPDFTDRRTQSVASTRPQEQWLPGAPGSGQPDDASRGLDSPDPKVGRVNPGHNTGKDASTPPKGGGDGELRDQPGSTAEARQPGADPHNTQQPHTQNTQKAQK